MVLNYSKANKADRNSRTRNMLAGALSALGKRDRKLYVASHMNESFDHKSGGQKVAP